ncbi:MAG: hypothetical protein R3B72_40430 [Polyangiaceae bacterium]
MKHLTGWGHWGRGLALAGLLMTPLLALEGCKKKVPEEGSTCEKDGDIICKDKKSAFLCAGGKWHEQPCGGATGCMSMPNANDSCVNNKHEEGAACVADGPTCRADGKAVMECQANKWVVIQKCAGMNGCVVNAKGWKCDMSTGDEGDPCMESSKDTFACSVDKKLLLRCDGKKMVKHAQCAGRHGCRKSFEKIDCDGEKPL